MQGLLGKEMNQGGQSGQEVKQGGKSPGQKKITQEEAAMLQEAVSEGNKVLYKNGHIKKIVGQIDDGVVPENAVSSIVVPMVKRFEQARQPSDTIAFAFAAIMISQISKDLERVGAIPAAKGLIPSATQAAYVKYLDMTPEKAKEAGMNAQKYAGREGASEQEVMEMKQKAGL